jgi:hypothetical protein
MDTYEDTGSCDHKVSYREVCEACREETLKLIVDMDKDLVETMDTLSELFIATEDPNGPDCKGLFYRYKKSAYRTKAGGYASTETITLLKRMSCKGCNWCAGTEDMIHSEWDNLGVFPIILPDGINSGDIIRPYVVAVSTDWESGYPDDWEIHATVVVGSKV